MTPSKLQNPVKLIPLVVIEVSHQSCIYQNEKFIINEIKALTAHGVFGGTRELQCRAPKLQVSITRSTRDYALKVKIIKIIESLDRTLQYKLE